MNELKSVSRRIAGLDQIILHIDPGDPSRQGDNRSIHIGQAQAHWQKISFAGSRVDLEKHPATADVDTKAMTFNPLPFEGDRNVAVTAWLASINADQ
jgi:hypothetical protein